MAASTRRVASRLTGSQIRGAKLGRAHHHYLPIDRRHQRATRGWITMAANTTARHSVMRRLIRPFEYRHLHAVGGVRLAAGGFQLGVGLVLVSLGRQARTDRERRKCYGWAAWFLGMAALQLLGGYMDMTVASSERRPPA